MKNSKLKLYRFILLAGMMFCCAQVNAQNLLNLPEPAAGSTRYPSYAAIEKSWPAAHGQGSICFWGDDKFAAVSLTIDDNNYPDVTFWRQVSAEFGWKLTWFLIVYPGMWDIYNNVPGNNVGYNGSAAQWKTLYDEGHEIGLHGSCAMNTNSEAYYLDHMNRSITHLESVISNNIVTYAYPCGTVDSPTAVDGFRNVCSNLFIGARGTTGGATSPFTGDYMNTYSMGAAFNQDTFNKMEDNTRALLYSSYRGWAVFLWHGLLGDTNKIAGAYEVFNYLAANEDKYWIKTFGEVARYAQERESGVLNVTSVAADQIQFTLTDSMTNSLFNYPLTVKFRVDNWADAVAVQNGQSIPVSLVTYSNNTYALVQAVPDQGTVVLSKAASAAFSVSPSSGWAPLTVTFTDTSTLIGITNRYWNFGDGFTTNTAAAAITHTYTSAGTNTVQLTVGAADGLYTNIQVAAVTVTLPVAPSAAFNVSPASGYYPLAVTFTDTSSGDITNRYWDFGDGSVTNITSAGIVHTYTAAGTNTVRLIVTGPAGASTNTQTAAVTVAAPVAPTAAFSATPVSGTAPLNVSFTDSSTGSITNRFWDFGDGVTTNTVATSLSHLYTSAGTRTVKLIVSGPAGAATNTQTGLITVTAAVGGAVTNIIANTADNYIGLNASDVRVLGSASSAALSIGDDNAGSSRSNQCAVIMFALPALQAGQAVTTANLALEISTGFPGGTFPKGVDIYGLRYSASSAVSTNDYGFGILTGTNDVLIMDNIAQFAQNITYNYTVYETDAAADAVLANWINAQYAAGAVGGNYVFLRIHPDTKTANSINVASANSTTNTKPTLTLEIGSAAPDPDSDNDGIPDEWENQYFGGTNANPSALAANGMNTIREMYIAGLNPTNPQSVLAVSGGPAVAGMQLQWTAVSGRVYGIYRATNLISGFQPLETNILWPRSGWTGAMNNAEGFCRLKVELAPAN